MEYRCNGCYRVALGRSSGCPRRATRPSTPPAPLPSPPLPLTRHHTTTNTTNNTTTTNNNNNDENEKQQQELPASHDLLKPEVVARMDAEAEALEAEHDEEDAQVIRGVITV